MKNIKDYTIGEAMEICKRKGEQDVKQDDCEGCPFLITNKDACVFAGYLFPESWNIE